MAVGGVGDGSRCDNNGGEVVVVVMPLTPQTRVICFHDMRGICWY